MRQTTRKILTAVIAVIFMTTTDAMAQDGLNIAKVFEKYGNMKGYKMVEMSNTLLHGHNIRVYKSLTYKHHDKNIETLMKEDRRKALKIREIVDNGTVTSGYYMMRALDGEINRYILFSNSPYGSGALIYIEGKLSPDDIMRICYSKKKK